jgi:phytoene synthase
MNESNNFSLKKRAKTFYFASLFFPKGIRTDIETLYLFCRYVDDIGDTFNLKKKFTEDKLKRIIVDINKLNSNEPIISKFILLVKKHKINKKIPIKLVEGILDDLGKVYFNTESELIKYSYKVAGTVGVMVCNIFKVKEKDLKFKGIQLGIAMQITNIARDIEEDLLRNRIYFPEELRSLKIKRTNKIIKNENYKRTISNDLEKLLTLADDIYDNSWSGINKLPITYRIPIAIASYLYQSIGFKIRKDNYNIWNKRHHLNLIQKIIKSLQVLVKLIFHNRDKTNTELEKRIHSILNRMGNFYCE